MVHYIVLKFSELWSSKNTEFKRLKGVHPLVDQQFSYVRLAAPLLDTVVIVLFCGR